MTKYVGITPDNLRKAADLMERLYAATPDGQEAEVHSLFVILDDTHVRVKGHFLYTDSTGRGEFDLLVNRTEPS